MIKRQKLHRSMTVAGLAFAVWGCNYYPTHNQRTEVQANDDLAVESRNKALKISDEVRSALKIVNYHEAQLALQQALSKCSSTTDCLEESLKDNNFEKYSNGKTTVYSCQDDNLVKLPYVGSRLVSVVVHDGQVSVHVAYRAL